MKYVDKKACQRDVTRENEDRKKQEGRREEMNQRRNRPHVRTKGETPTLRFFKQQKLAFSKSMKRDGFTSVQNHSDEHFVLRIPPSRSSAHFYQDSKGRDPAVSYGDVQLQRHLERLQRLVLVPGIAMISGTCFGRLACGLLSARCYQRRADVLWADIVFACWFLHGAEMKASSRTTR